MVVVIAGSLRVSNEGDKSEKGGDVNGSCGGWWWWRERVAAAVTGLVRG